MVFSSPLFVFAFLPLVLAVYYLLPRRVRHLGLTALSYLFYGWTNPLFMVLMATSTVVDYLCGLAMVGRLGPRFREPIERLGPGGSVVEVGDQDIDDLIAEFSSRTFDLAVDRPFRARLIRVSDTRHVLVLVSHHIVGDRESSRLLLDELAATYRALAAGEPPFPELPIEYADYAVWHRHAVDPTELERQVVFWVERLKPFDRPSRSLVDDGSPGGDPPGAARRCRGCGIGQMLDES